MTAQGFANIFSFHKSLWRQHSKHMQLCFILANLIRRPRPNKLCLYFVSACSLTSVYRKAAFFCLYSPVPNERQSPIFKSSLVFGHLNHLWEHLEEKKKKKKGARRASETSNDKKVLDCKKKKKLPLCGRPRRLAHWRFYLQWALDLFGGEVERGLGTNRAVVVGVRSGEEGGWEGPIDSWTGSMCVPSAALSQSRREWRLITSHAGFFPAITHSFSNYLISVATGLRAD